MIASLPNATVLLGLIAGAFTTFSALPQLLRALRTKSSGDISPAMLASMILGTILWVIYGAVIGSLPLILWNVASCIIWSCVAGLRIVHTRAY